MAEQCSDQMVCGVCEITWDMNDPCPPACRIANEGRKDDTDKNRLELVPPELALAVGAVLTFGARKYGDRNWERGMSWGRIFGALMRHLWAWWGGKGPTTRSFLLGELDDETGLSHLWHAGCCIGFLIAYEERNIGTDDRGKAGH